MLKNSKLEKLFKLSSKLVVYIPSTMDINITVDTSVYIDACASLLSKCFGGATSTEAIGYWNSPSKGLVKERSVMVFAYATTEALNEHLDEVIEFCERVKTELKQDSVRFELNGEMYFI